MSTDAKQDKEAKQELDKTDKLLDVYTKAVAEYGAQIFKAREKAASVTKIKLSDLKDSKGVTAAFKSMKSSGVNDAKQQLYWLKANAAEKAVAAILQAKKLAAMFSKGYDAKKREKQKADYLKLKVALKGFEDEAAQQYKDLQKSAKDVLKTIESSVKQAEAQRKSRKDAKAASDKDSAWSDENIKLAKEFAGWIGSGLLKALENWKPR